MIYKNFKHLDIKNFENLSCLSTPLGRFYIAPNGKKYPSVTNILSDYNKEALDKWRKRIGEKEAQKICNRSSDRGNKLHDLIEQYLQNKDIELIINGYPSVVKILFKNLLPKLNRIDNIHLQETALYSDVLSVAGRVDLIAEFDGKLSIIDFKSSNKAKKKEWIFHHYMQAASYAFMYYERTKIVVKRIIIMIASEQDMCTQIFEGNPKDYIKPFKKQIDLFYEKIL